MALSKKTDTLLAGIARTPFASTAELAAFTGVSINEAGAYLGVMARQGLADRLKVASQGREIDNRWHLTAEGVAKHPLKEKALLRKYALSERWARRLVRRIEAVEVMYKVGAELAGRCGGLQEWYWYSVGAFDAFVKLGNGREFVLMRLGATLSWKAQRSRLGTMLNAQANRKVPPVLMVVQSTVDEQRIAADLRNRMVWLHMATEKDLLADRTFETRVWRSVSSPKRMTLRELLKSEPSRPGRGNRTAQGGDRPRRSALTSGRSLGPSERLVLELPRPAKRLLWTIYDWPLMRHEQLSTLMGLSSGRLTEWRAHLIKNDMACQIRIGGSPAARQENGTRFCVGTEGLRYLGRVDRRRLTELVRHWSIEKGDGGTPDLHVQRHEVKGTKLRVLIKELQHTDGVNEFVSMLSMECWQSGDWNLAYALPPHRWERWFIFNRRRISIRPDATFDLRFRGLARSFFLEYEVRADRPSRVDDKLSRYERYYDGMATRFDFDRRRPTVLMVFKDVGTASRFLTYVGQATDEIPMLVSSMDVLRESGITGRSWRSPWHLDRGDVSLRVGMRG